MRYVPAEDAARVGGADEILDIVVDETRNWAGLLQDDVALLAVKWTN